jgi:hypothetical protein
MCESDEQRFSNPRATTFHTPVKHFEPLWGAPLHSRGRNPLYGGYDTLRSPPEEQRKGERPPDYRFSWRVAWAPSFMPKLGLFVSGGDLWLGSSRIEDETSGVSGQFSGVTAAKIGLIDQFALQLNKGKKICSHDWSGIGSSTRDFLSRIRGWFGFRGIIRFESYCLTTTRGKSKMMDHYEHIVDRMRRIKCQDICIFIYLAYSIIMILIIPSFVKERLIIGSVFFDFLIRVFIVFSLYQSIHFWTIDFQVLWRRSIF